MHSDYDELTHEFNWEDQILWFEVDKNIAILKKVVLRLN